MNSDIAAVVVTYNSAKAVGGCLRSLQGKAEVTVVDNASADDTCRRVEQAAPHVQLIRNATNRGFAAATNQGIRATSNPLVLLLNPDTVVLTALEPLVEQCRRPDVGAVGGQLVDRQGSFQRGFSVRSFPTPATLAAEVLLLNRLWPANPVNRRYRRLDFDPDRPQPVDQPAGAFLMARREVLERVGYLDERFYPLWFEDVDLCLRIRGAGYSIHYVPSCKAQHQGAHSLHALPLEQRHLAWYGNLLRFVYKHFSTVACLWLRPLILLGLLLRWLACWLGAGTPQERTGYQGAIRLVCGLPAAVSGR